MQHNTTKENYVIEYKPIWNLKGENPMGKNWMINFYYDKIKFS